MNNLNYMIYIKSFKVILIEARKLHLFWFFLNSVFHHDNDFC